MGRRSGKPATNRLSYDTATVLEVSYYDSAADSCASDMSNEKLLSNFLRIQNTAQ
jgi:hypothetical protein